MNSMVGQKSFIYGHIVMFGSEMSEQGCFLAHSKGAVKAFEGPDSQMTDDMASNVDSCCTLISASRDETAPHAIRSHHAL